MELRYLSVYKNIQHMKEVGGRRYWGTIAPDKEIKTYKMDFPTVGGPRNYPAEGCRGWEETQTAIWVNFLHRHVRDTVIILYEGNPPHTRCP